MSKVSLQDLLNHTATRILEAKSKTELEEVPWQLNLVSKWGCDGSSGHSEYHQNFTSDNTSDKNMFLTSLVPLTLTDLVDSNNVCWKNLLPSSIRFCRPLKFEFVKETADVITSEVGRVQNEKKNLNKTIITISDKIFEVSHSLVLAMIDGKVANTITQTSSNAVCYICKAKPSEMNNLEILIMKPESEEALKFGVSPLHARIKFMECILHIAYNKDFAAWRTNSATKDIREQTKKIIQGKLKLSLGINVDMVKQGMGTTNDGNTSRRFFENPRITAEAVGVDENLIHRFKVILITINSNADICPNKFQQYCSNTAQLYVRLYSWYYMPMTVHKVLIHGGKIIAAAILPIGMLSEEAQEARNRDYREYRRYHARKCSRISTNEDVMHLLLASSDPFINKFRKVQKKQELDLPEDVKELLL